MGVRCRRRFIASLPPASTFDTSPCNEAASEEPNKNNGVIRPAGQSHSCRIPCCPAICTLMADDIAAQCIFAARSSARQSAFTSPNRTVLMRKPL